MQTSMYVQQWSPGEKDIVLECNVGRAHKSIFYVFFFSANYRDKALLHYIYVYYRYVLIQSHRPTFTRKPMLPLPFVMCYLFLLYSIASVALQILGCPHGLTLRPRYINSLYYFVQSFVISSNGTLHMNICLLQRDGCCNVSLLMDISHTRAIVNSHREKMEWNGSG